MNIFLTNQSEVKSAQAIIFRNVPFCASWAILLVVAAVVWGAGGASAIGLIGLFFFVYAFQALAAEVLGAKVSSYNISAPRRFGFLPALLVLWRIEGSLKTIGSVVSISDKCACLKWLSDVHTTLIFSDRDQKRRFFSLLRQLEPDIDLRKGR